MITRCHSLASALLSPALNSVPRVFSCHPLLSRVAETLPVYGRISRGISGQYSGSDQSAIISISPWRVGISVGQEVSGGKVLHNCQFRSLHREIQERRIPGRRFRTFNGVAATDSQMKAFSGIGPADGQDLQEKSSFPEVSGSEEYLVGGRYCVLLTGHCTEYCQTLYGGYGKMFIKLLADPHDTWDVYPVVDGQFPPEKELEQYDGFVVTGSRHDAHGSEDWIAKLCSLLQSLHEKKVKTLGVCFGHQVLSRALGGKTGRANVGWELGLRQIHTTEALAKKPYAAGFPPVFKVFEVHQDQVQMVPPGGELLGFSERTGIELFAVGDHVLAIQGHPEYTEDVVTDIIDSRLASGVLKEEVAKAAMASLESGQPDKEALVRLCKGFLKRMT